MKKIKLGGHYKNNQRIGYAIIDDEDFLSVNKYRWFLNSNGYAVTTTKPNIYMHRMINKTPCRMITDHINRNTLDNRRCNLRTADKRINSINRGLQSNNTSGYKGISWNKKNKKWETYIWKNQIKIGLGRFNNLNKAIFIRKQAELKYYETI
jgi:hypothetical protein